MTTTDSAEVQKERREAIAKGSTTPDVRGMGMYGARDALTKWLREDSKGARIALDATRVEMKLVGMDSGYHVDTAADMNRTYSESAKAVRAAFDTAVRQVKFLQKEGRHAQSYVSNVGDTLDSINWSAPAVISSEWGAAGGLIGGLSVPVLAETAAIIGIGVATGLIAVPAAILGIAAVKSADDRVRHWLRDRRELKEATA